VADDLTRAFVRDIRAIAAGNFPDEVRWVAKACILDWLGAAIAGAREPLVSILLEEAGSADTGGCTLVQQVLRASPYYAALVNGAAGDALDFSDCIRVMNGHATAAVLPAALAMSEAGGHSGDELLRALVVGVEAACRAGLIAGPGILLTAFHPTGIFGPIGSCAAVAHLLSLDEPQWSVALGIAATSAAGLGASAGTMCKPLHAGVAAAHGLLAARLAHRGFTASATVLEHPVGFLAAYTKTPNFAALADCSGRFFVRETLLKEHAACQLTHGSIESLLQLRRSHAFSVDDIDSVRLTIAESSVRICDIREPHNALEAKFSVRTVAAMALLGIATGDLASFDHAFAGASDVVNLRSKVSVIGESNLDVAVSKASVTLRDGRILTAQYDERDLLLDLDRRLKRARAKFRKLSAPYLPAARCAEIEALVFALEREASVRPLLHACCAS
jgi:2-methylcitrate dehydratase PrpD